jgi:hypothetical protein
MSLGCCDFDTSFLVALVIAVLAFSGSGAAVVVLLYQSYDKSETWLWVTAGCSIPIVFSFAGLAYTRLRMWKGRPPIMEGKFVAGSSVRRWQFEELKEDFSGLVSAPTNSDEDENSRILRILPRYDNQGESEHLIQPLQFYSSNNKKNLYAYWVLAIFSSGAVLAYIWCGLYIFHLAIGLQRKGSEVECDDYDKLHLWCFLWSMCLLLFLPAINYSLFVLSRGTSHAASLVSIILPFITVQREVYLCQRGQDRWIMKVKRYWKVGEEFVRKCEEWNNKSTILKDFLWYFFLWCVVWALLNVFAAEFISRGILDVQRYVGAIPDDWSCFLYNKSLHDGFSCSYAIKAGDEFNVSTSDLFACFKLRNMTLDSTSEMTGALGISFSVFLFAVTALRISLKFLGGLCSTRKESHPQKNPVIFYRIFLIAIGISYYSVVTLTATLASKRPIPVFTKTIVELTNSAWVVISFCYFLFFLEYSTEENNIPWTSIKLLDEDNKRLNQLR